MTDKLILDACCGGRMMWFDKSNPNVLFTDIRCMEKGTLQVRPNFSVEPDQISDYRKMTFPDESFQMVVWDPPHVARHNNKSWMSEKYGMLCPDTWEEDLRTGFSECWRVLKFNGVLVFKWSEANFSVQEVLKLFPEKPLFGHTTGKSGSTKWMCFMKIRADNGNYANKKEDKGGN